MRRNLNIYSRDAQQQALAFLVSQTSYIEPTVYRIQYPEIRYPRLIPIDTSAPEWAPSVTYFSSDQVGAADWFTGKADDVPHAEVTREMFTSGVKMGAIGYGYDLEELGIAMMQGMDLNADKATAARRAAEEFIDAKVLFGDSNVNFSGFLNNANVTPAGAPDGAAAAPEWSTKTPDEILLDVNTELTGVYEDSKQVLMADTILLPLSRYTDIGTRRLSEHSELTVLQWILRNNVYTLETGSPLTIMAVRGLETAGAGDTARMVTYRRSPEVLKFHMPMPFRFLPVYQTGPIKFEVPGIMRLGGVDIRLPAAVRYLDEI